MKTTLIVLALALAGLIDTGQQQALLASRTIDVCSRSYQALSGPLERQCGELIDKVQADGKHEVIRDGQQFKVERK